MLTKKDLEHLAALARIEMGEGEDKKLQKDLGAILDYFEELKQVNTDGVEPMAGGTHLKNVLREDKLYGGNNDDTGKGANSFPDQEKGFLRVPKIL